MKKLLSFILIGMFVLSGCHTNTKIKIAIIDTGFSTKSISEQYILEGKNYLDPQASTQDTYGHGTAVASIILDMTSDVLLIPLVNSAYEDGKLIQVDNETFAQMIKDAVDEYDCDIINISAGLVLDKNCIKEACDYAYQNNVLIVDSAGNDYLINKEVKYYPASYDTVLSVGSLDSKGEISEFSQRGDWVDLYVPGEDIPIKTLSGNTRISSGTSFSTAKVSAQAARLLSQNQNINLEQLISKLKKSTFV